MQIIKSNTCTSRTDAWGRVCNYLRLSITDRCNLGCLYCVSCKRQRYIPHAEILRYEEFYRLADLAVGLGVKKIRVTGGEPFCRAGCMDFLAGLRTRHTELALAITTNATLIGPMLNDLAKLNLASVNISLDSFDRTTFARITGKDLLTTVLDNIEGLLSLGQAVKINAVAMANITDRQITDFIHAIRHWPVDLRFIEYMPMGGNTLWDGSQFLSCSDLRRLLASKLRLEAVDRGSDHLAGPARIFSVPGARGRIGFISAVSDHFCATCNRIRITSSGGMRMCLFSDHEISLSPLLRDPAIPDQKIIAAMQAAIAEKPLGSALLMGRSKTAVAGSQMVGIGG